MKQILFASAALALLAIACGQAAAGGYDCGPKCHSGGFGFGVGVNVGVNFSGSCWKGGSCGGYPCPVNGVPVPAPGYPAHPGHDHARLHHGYGQPAAQAVAYQNPYFTGTYPAMAYGYNPYAAPAYGAYQNSYAWGQYQAPAAGMGSYTAPVYPVNALSSNGW
jgi:hypothetical protein